MAKVVGIFIAPAAGAVMRCVGNVRAEAGRGLVGDRYSDGSGSWQKGTLGKRQVTFLDAAACTNTPYVPADTRRNIVTEDIDLMTLIGRTYTIGTTTFRGVKYCEPCKRPGKLLRKDADFNVAFRDMGGIIAEVLSSGLISIGDEIVIHS